MKVIIVPFTRRGRVIKDASGTVGDWDTMTFLSANLVSRSSKQPGRVVEKVDWDLSTKYEVCSGELVASPALCTEVPRTASIVCQEVEVQHVCNRNLHIIGQLSRVPYHTRTSK